ncbi:S16 family serine protease [Candidatus Solincola sp.]|nr:PDZ domain-containing protein [Actinomycetota bacterium]
MELVLAFLLPLAFLLTSVPTGFVLESPGPSFDLQAELEVEGAETHPSRGEFLLTSVSLRESNLVYQLLSLAKRDNRLIEARRFLGEELDMETQDRLDGALTVLSQETAAVLALRGAGLEVEVKELGALVLGVVEGSPAQGRLNPGQVIATVDGVPVKGSTDLGERIAAASEGEEVVLGVREIDWEALGSSLKGGEWSDPEELMAGETREVSLIPVWDWELGRRVIGVYTRDYFACRSPVRVTWKMESVRGPSAGLMMTLSLLNLLLPEDLTHGRRVAGTGEVFLDGRVGAIGGLPMKIKAAEARGAEVFLYPRQNQDDLAGVDTRMRLIPVDSLEEALKALSPTVD